MAWYMSKVGYEFKYRAIKDKLCRQQEGGVDCGVHVMWWAEAYVREQAAFWYNEHLMDPNSYRTQIALRFLRDANAM